MTQLKEVAFACVLDFRWIVPTLQTITNNHRNFRQILLDATRVASLGRFDAANPAPAIGETTYQNWSELDRTLFQFWESRSIRFKVVYDAPLSADKDKVRTCLESLLPKVMKEGAAELITRN